MPDAVRVTMPFVDINAFKGLATKQNPETLDPVFLREAKNVDFFRTYGAISKVRGNKRLLNSVYTESSVVKQIGWTGFYKFPDPNGSIQRHVLAACGTTLRKINADGTTTQLTTGLNEGLIRTSDKLDRFMFITGQDMYRVGNKDKMMLYNGDHIQDWGLKAPGSTETIREDFSTTMVINYSNASAGTISIQNESDITWNGNAKKIICSTAGTFRFNSVYGAFAIPTATPNRVKFYVYIPRNQFNNLSTGSTTNSALQVSFGSTAPAVNNPIANNYFRYYFPRSVLKEGWNELFCDLSLDLPAAGNSIGIEVGTYNPAATTVIEWQWITTGAATVYMDYLVTLDQGAPGVTLTDPDSEALMSFATNTEGTVNTFIQSENFADVTHFNVTPAGAPANVLSLDTTLGLSTVSTPSCMVVDKLDTTTAYFLLSRNITGADLNFDVTNGKDGKFSIWIYIPDATKLRPFGNLAVRFFVSSEARPLQGGARAAIPTYNGVTMTGGAGWTATCTYWDKYYGITESFVNGWNQLIFDSAAPSGNVGSAATLTSVKSFAIAVHFNATATTMSGIRFDAFGKNHTFIDYDTSTYFENVSSGGPTLPNTPTSFEMKWDAGNTVYTGWDDVALSQQVLKIDKVVTSRSSSSTVLVTCANGSGNFVPQYINGPAKILFYFFIPDPTLMVSTFPVEFSLYTLYSATNPSTNVYSRWVVPSTQITSGWNTIEVDLTSPDTEGNGGINDYTTETVTHVGVKFLFNGDQTVAKGLYLLGLLSFKSTGALTGGGIYSYRVTYETEEGFESNAGPESAEVQVSTGGQNVTLDFTNVVSSDSSVTKKNIYRTAGGGGLWLYLDTIPNSQTSYVDSIADGALGTSQPPFPGDTTFDNSTPPSAGIVKVWKRTVFLAGDPLNPQLLYFSRPDNPSSFPLLNTYELDSRITGMYESYLGLVVTTETDTWRVVGDNPEYTVEKVVPGIGAVGPRAVGSIRLDGWAVNRDGLRLYDLRNMVPISEVIRDKFFNLPKKNIELIHSIHFRKMNTYLQFNPDNNGLYNSVFMYQYEVDDARTGVGWSELNLPSSVNILHTTEVEDDNGEWHLYAASSDGMLYELFAEDSFNWVDSNGNTSPIVTEFSTHYMRLGALGQETQIGTGRVRPRQVEIRAEEKVGLESLWTVTVETAYGPNDGAFSFGVENMIFTLPPGVSLYRMSNNPQLVTPASHIRLSVINSQADVDVIFYGLRMELFTLPDQRPIESGNVY